FVFMTSPTMSRRSEFFTQSGGEARCRPLIAYPGRIDCAPREAACKAERQGTGLMEATWLTNSAAASPFGGRVAEFGILSGDCFADPRNRGRDLTRSGQRSQRLSDQRPRGLRVRMHESQW